MARSTHPFSLGERCGSATAALVVIPASYHTWSPSLQKGTPTILFPNDHVPGKPVIAGVLGRLVEKMIWSNGAVPPSQATGYVVPFDPEVIKTTALEMLEKAGVEFLFHAFASGIIPRKKRNRCNL